MPHSLFSQAEAPQKYKFTIKKNPQEKKTQRKSQLPEKKEKGGEKKKRKISNEYSRALARIFVDASIKLSALIVAEVHKELPPLPKLGLQSKVGCAFSFSPFPPSPLFLCLSTFPVYRRGAASIAGAWHFHRFAKKKVRGLIDVNYKVGCLPKKAAEKLSVLRKLRN